MSQYQIGVHVFYSGNNSLPGYLLIALHEPGEHRRVSA